MTCVGWARERGEDGFKMTTIAGEPIHVVYASDEQYAMPLCACLASAIHFLDPTIELRVSLLDAGIQERTKTKLRRLL